MLFSWLVNGLVHRANPKLSRKKLIDAISRDIDILLDGIATKRIAIIFQCCDSGRTCPQIWIEDIFAFIGKRKNQTFGKPNRELTRMIHLLDVIRFDIRDFPHI